MSAELDTVTTSPSKRDPEDVTEAPSNGLIDKAVKKAHRSVQRRRSEKKRQTLLLELKESRDSVLNIFDAKKRPPPTVVHPRLPSNSSSTPSPTPLENIKLCLPCSVPNNVQANDKGLSFKSRHFPTVQTLRPTLWIEGTHPSLPPSTATVFLRKSYVIEDDKKLTHVPYFGDDDREDFVSELFDTAARQREAEFGSGYKERETTECISEIFVELEGLGRLGSRNDRVFEVLAGIFDLREETVTDLYDIQFGKVNGVSKGGSERKKSIDHVVVPYEELIDSYRNLFCRRCFNYDCNVHGNHGKPDLELQCQLAIKKENVGYWNNSGILCDENSSSDDVAESISASNLPKTPINGQKRKRPASPQSKEDDETQQQELTPFQKSIIPRSFLMFQGNLQQISSAIQAPPHLISQYIASQNLELPPPSEILPDSNKKKKNNKASNKFSMKNYNLSWLNRVADAKIHPAFNPCNHPGSCSEDNCTCVKNAFFCTKHCLFGEESPNYFQGCNCKFGKCHAKSCSCFAAKRECDPDLCLSCGACGDAPNQPAVTQRCRNDSIGMRRHCHLLLAESGIKDAGWGVYTKFKLKKGDFVHEYVGEVISQEEAERRGRIYDKVNRSYLFNLSSDFVVDANRKGNKTKFANHSSKPNCYTKTIFVNGDTRIGIFAKEDIAAQSELFFDYRYDSTIDNDLIHKPGQTVEWQKDPTMANKISKQN